MEVGARRSDRWEARAPARRNWPAAVAWVCVLLAGVATTLAALGAAGSVRVSDAASIALAAAVPSSGILAVAFGSVGARRGTARAASWIAFALGVLVVVASVAVTATVLVELRGLG